MNLVYNAAEYNDRERPDIKVTAWGSSNFIGVAVRDDRPGIPDEELEVLSEWIETPSSTAAA